MAEPRRALRGRFIRKQICDSKSVAELIKKRGPWAGLLFERMILWGDDDGRLVAEPQVIKAHCIPWHDRSVRQVQADLEEMHRLGLIVLYKVGGTQYAAFPGWHQHQPAPRPGRRIASEIPPPPTVDDQPSGGHAGSQSGRQIDSQPDNTLRARALPVGGAEEEDEEEGEEEGLKAMSAARRRRGSGRQTGAQCPWCAKPTSNPLQWYHDEAKRVLGRCLVIDGTVCGPLIAKRERELGRERCRELFAAYLASQDPFVLERGHSLKLFCSSSMLDSLVAALDGGYTHGARRQKPRRQPPASAAAFTQTGRVR